MILSGISLGLESAVYSALLIGAAVYGAFLLGAGTLRDIALALFIGIVAGTFSSIFIATPVEVSLREREAAVREHTKAVLEARAASGTVAAELGPESVRVGAAIPGYHRGTAAQPRKKKNNRGPGRS